MRLKLIHDEISAAYRSAKKNNKTIVFSKWAEDSFEGMDPYEKIVGFRDIFFRKYAYDLADSGLITVLYDNDFLKEISDWLDTAAYIIFGDSNSLVWKYVHDGEVFKPRITKKMCDTLCRKDESYLIWHNILLSILPMYNDKIAKLHISRYEYSLPLSKRLCDMTGSDERFIRSLLTCITDHAEYEGKSIRTFKKLKQGYWECLPLQNRMELYNRIEDLIENQNLHKYMLIDSYKDAAQRVLRLYNKLLEPGYYRICLKMDIMMNCIYGKQCISSKEAGNEICEFE